MKQKPWNIDTMQEPMMTLYGHKAPKVKAIDEILVNVTSDKKLSTEDFLLEMARLESICGDTIEGMCEKGLQQIR